MRSFLHKQGELLFKKQYYALFLIVAFAFLPLTGWLALTLVGLMTLRCGAREGLIFMFAGIAASALASNMVSAQMTDVLPMLVISTVSVYALSCLQRFFASWAVTGMIALFTALGAVVIIHTWIPEYISAQLRELITIFSQIPQADGLVDVLNSAVNTSDSFLPNYLLGVKVFAETMSVFSALITARFIQSLLFYPEGFKKELLAFRANKLIVLLMVICLTGVYANNGLAFSCLPILVSYLSIAGICLCVNLLAKRKGVLITLMLGLPLVFAPSVMLPVYVIFGSLDSLFNFRLRLPAKAA